MKIVAYPIGFCSRCPQDFL